MEEEKEIQQLINSVVQSGGRGVEQHFNQYKSILTKYQEQPQLLDGVLEGIVQPLALLLRQAAASSTAEDTALVQGVCRMLHVLITVRGYKTVVRFFPHEAADLERVLQVLGFTTDQAAAGSHGATSGLWEAQAVLLLWLSILILIPFDLVILDSSVTDSNGCSTANTGYPPLAAKLMAFCQGFLSRPGAVREMAALLLARLLTRPDMPAALADFISWQQQALAEAAGPQAVFLLPGVLQTLAQIYKLGRREQLLQWAPVVWQQLSGLLAEDVASGLATNALARKLAVKLAQRLGLVMLPPQLAGWRYVQAAEDMAKNLQALGDQSAACSMEPQPATLLADAAAEVAIAAACTAAEEAAAAADASGSEELPEIPAEIEDVLGVLLGSCSDRDTIVRWSAAKGVGRLAGCLPCELAEEVVQGVLALLSPAEPDTAWHGGCLAIAELARRSILSPDLLTQVATPLTAALTYDVRRGPHSVGAHVRDAAAYVCWALARSYEPRQLTACVHALASSLLVVTCYDREVNCRRAAAAAFQESVGRLGSFPHGLEILSVADYYSVGNMVSAYLKVAPFVAQYEEYTQALLDHLLLVKLRHWDKPVRALAAMGLAALSYVASKQLAAQCLPQLLQLVTDDVLEVRCGAVLGIAELLPALAAAGQQQLDGSVSSAVVQVLGRLEPAACYKGKGGELMREMAARLVQQVAAACAGLQVVPLYGSGSAASSASSSNRHQAEHDMDSHQQQQKQKQQAGQGSRVHTPQGGINNNNDNADTDDGDDGDSSCGDEGQADAAGVAGAPKQQQQLQQQRRRLVLPLTCEFHAAAVRLLLDCISHVQDSIQAAGVSALKAYACAFQQDQQQQLLQVVDQCCHRLSEREVSGAAAARRGAAAALGVMPRGLLCSRAQEVLGVLVAAAQEPLDPVTGFTIEPRIAAVGALAQLTQELTCSQTALQAGSPGSAPSAAAAASGSACQPRVPLSVLKDCVLPALLGALRDYSRDNRGDVGSWVREAAMDGTTQVFLLLSTMLHSYEQQAQQHGGHQHAVQQAEVSTAAAAPATAAVEGGGERVWSMEELRALHSSLAVKLVGNLLQQSLERIARLRESALINLQRILQHPAAAAAVPGAGAIAAALPGDAAELAGVASLACVSRMGALLQLPWFRLAVVEGLVVSIGGVDASLSKEASTALLSQVGSSSSSRADAAVVAAAAAGPQPPAAALNSAEGHTALRSSVASLLLQLWQQETGSARLSLPLIKTAALLISHADFGGVEVASVPAANPPGGCQTTTTISSSKPLSSKPDSSIGANTNGSSGSTTTTSCSFAFGVLQQLKCELRGCGDVAKLLEGVALLAQLACIPDCSASAIQTVMVMLVNRYPKVRRAMAEQLYLQVLAVQSEADTAEQGGVPDQSMVLAGPAAFSSLQQVPPDDLEAALDVLLISAWDGPLEAVRASREELAEALHVEIKTRRVAKQLPDSLAGVCGGLVKSVEQESYQSLLDDAARGGGY